jgi:hypothetical protein
VAQQAAAAAPSAEVFRQLSVSLSELKGDKDAAAILVQYAANPAIRDQLAAAGELRRWVQRCRVMQADSVCGVVRQQYRAIVATSGGRKHKSRCW